MRDDDIKRIEEHLLALTKREAMRSVIRSSSRTMAKWLGVLAAATALVSFVVSGTEFFTKVLPKAGAGAAKFVLLGETFRPFLTRRIVGQEMAYDGVCIGQSQTMDLDGDGDETDLIVELNPPTVEADGVARCSEETGRDASYAMLKEVDWSKIWPKYTLLRLLSRDVEGAFSDLGTGFPLSFEKMGPFIVGSIYGTDFPGYVVYGYANGLLHDFGQFRPMGSLLENPQAVPRAQIGNRLFIHAENGMQMLEVASDGQFHHRRMTAREIVARNNATIVLEDATVLQETSPSTEGERAVPSDRSAYQVEEQSLPDCDRKIFLNGKQAVFSGKDAHGACTIEIELGRLDVVLPNLPCQFEGFRPTSHFPWGMVVDPASRAKFIRCPEDGESDAYAYQVTVKVKS